jgi:hypothetical protein
VSPSALAAIKIFKIRYDPPGPDYRTNSQLNAEYIVVHNTGTRKKQLRGWVIKVSQVPLTGWGILEDPHWSWHSQPGGPVLGIRKLYLGQRRRQGDTEESQRHVTR